MKLTVIFFLLLGAIACKSNRKVNNAPETPGTPMISLATSPCRGFCPVYKITVSSDGKAEYEGVRFVKEIGKSPFQLIPTELEDLKKLLQEVNLWQYPESFPVTIADAPGASLTIFKGSETKTIVGAVEIPKPIKLVHERLKLLATVHGFHLESVDPNAIDKASAKEVLVKLKPDVNAGNWISSFNNTTKAGVKLVHRVGAENIWVLNYDSSKQSVTDILTLLKSNASVIEAQENKEAQERGNHE